MNAFTIYFWGIADQVQGTFTLLTVLLIFAFIVFTTIYSAAKHVGDEDMFIPMRKQLFSVGLALFVSLIGATLTPDSKTIAAMVIIPEIVRSDAVKRDLPELYDMAIKKLKDELSPPPEKQ